MNHDPFNNPDALKDTEQHPVGEIGNAADTTTASGYDRANFRTIAALPQDIECLNDTNNLVCDGWKLHKRIVTKNGQRFQYIYAGTKVPGVKDRYNDTYTNYHKVTTKVESADPWTVLIFKGLPVNAFSVAELMETGLPAPKKGKTDRADLSCCAIQVLCLLLKLISEYHTYPNVGPLNCINKETVFLSIDPKEHTCSLFLLPIPSLDQLTRSPVNSTKKLAIKSDIRDAAKLYFEIIGRKYNPTNVQERLLSDCMSVELSWCPAIETLLQDPGIKQTLDACQDYTFTYQGELLYDPGKLQLPKEIPVTYQQPEEPDAKEKTTNNDATYNDDDEDDDSNYTKAIFLNNSSTEGA